MSEALNMLRAGLARNFASGPRAPETWSDPAGMEKVRLRVAKDHGGAGIQADPRTILAAIWEFRKSSAAPTFRDLKYVCLGVGAIDGRGWCLLSDEKLRTKVGQLVESQTVIHRRMRCFQALLSAYWTFPLYAAGTSAEAKAGWENLRAWLRSEREKLAKTGDHRPPWFLSLAGHIELLSNQPCDKFGKALLAGDASGLNDALDSLAIPRDSWVLEEAVFAQMKAADQIKDEPFKTALPELLAIAMGRSGVAVGEALRIRCVALLVSRYARCFAHPEQPALRDAATSTIGNPWLRRTNWDAWVRVDDQPDNQARDMVFGWLKGQLIADFFELLSADGTNDSRRLAYWLRFSPFVEDMWFALGTSAQSRRDSHFDDFRNRAKGRLLDLEETSADNNAFIMRIGAYLAVEFGAHGNAFYLLRWDALPKAVMRTLTSGRMRESVAVSQLRPSTHEKKLIHRDSPVAIKSWEQKFDDALISTLGVKPEARPPCVPPLEEILKEYSVDARDLRASGGALWILANDTNATVSRKFRGMGFSFRAARGWWKE